MTKDDLKEDFTNKIVEMLKAQDNFNSHQMHSGWIKEDYQWNIAVMQSTSKAIDSYGWKWWFESRGSYKQDIIKVKHEMINVWGWVLSRLMRSNYIGGYRKDFKLLADKIYLSYFNISLNDFDKDGFVEYISILASSNRDTVNEYYYPKHFFYCCECIGMTFDEIYDVHMARTSRYV